MLTAPLMHFKRFGFSIESFLAKSAKCFEGITVYWTDPSCKLCIQLPLFSILLLSVLLSLWFPWIRVVRWRNVYNFFKTFYLRPLFQRSIRKCNVDIASRMTRFFSTWNCIGCLICHNIYRWIIDIIFSGIKFLVWFRGCLSWMDLID